MLYDNDSSCVSASMPNIEGVASNSSTSCIVGVSANNKTPALPVSLIGSDEVNEHESLQINDSIIVGKLGNDSEQTEFGSSTNENRPIFSIIFRNRDIARLVSIGSELC
jgi:hypothetical protein